LLLEIQIEMEFLLVFLPDVVRGRSNDELERFIRDALQQIKTVARVDNDGLRRGEHF
jgi:hypothetical protein